MDKRRKQRWWRAAVDSEEAEGVRRQRRGRKAETNEAREEKIDERKKIVKMAAGKVVLMVVVDGEEVKRDRREKRGSEPETNEAPRCNIEQVMRQPGM